MEPIVIDGRTYEVVNIPPETITLRAGAKPGYLEFQSSIEADVLIDWFGRYRNLIGVFRVDMSRFFIDPENPTLPGAFILRQDTRPGVTISYRSGGRCGLEVHEWAETTETYFRLRKLHLLLDA